MPDEKAPREPDHAPAAPGKPPRNGEDAPSAESPAERNAEQPEATAGQLPETSITTLAQRIKDADSPVATAEIIRNIGGNQAPEIIEKLIPHLEIYLGSPSPELQLSTINTLARCRSPRATDLLFPLLKDPDPQIRQAARSALGRSGQDYLALKVKEAIRSKDSMHRRCALEAMEIIQREAVLELIKPLTIDPDAALATRARKLQRLLNRQMRRRRLHLSWQKIGLAGKFGLVLIGAMIMVNLYSAYFTIPEEPAGSRPGTVSAAAEKRAAGEAAARRRDELQRKYRGAGYNLAVKLLDLEPSPYTPTERIKLETLVNPILIEGYIALENQQYDKSIGLFKQALIVHQNEVLVVMYAAWGLKDIYEILRQEKNYHKYLRIYREAKANARQKGLL